MLHFGEAGAVGHQQDFRIGGTDGGDECRERLPARTRRIAGVYGDDFRGDGHQFVHLAHGGGDEHFAVGVIAFDDADNRQVDVFTDGADIFRRIGADACRTALGSGERHPPHDER